MTLIPLTVSFSALLTDRQSDAALLKQYLRDRDAESFALLVRRHGPIVLNVCRRMIPDRHLAEDAFQAVFMVLARKAEAVRPPERLPQWLYGVAYRVSQRARAMAARRAKRERTNAAMPDVGRSDHENDDLAAVIDEAIAVLSGPLRDAVILCELKGMNRKDAARQLGIAEGTLSSRLASARRKLAGILRHRGVVLPAGAMIANAAVPPSLLTAAVQAFSNPHAVSATVRTLAQTGVGMLLANKLKIGVFAAVLSGFLTGGVSWSLASPAEAEPTAMPSPKKRYDPIRKDAAKAAPVPAAAADKATIEALADMEGHLLLNRKVLKDLKCDFDQFDKIMDAMEAAQKRAQDKTSEAMAQFRANPAAGRNPVGFQKMVAEAQEVGAKELNKAVAGVVADALTPAQRKRLREIDLQARGHEAFTTPAVAKALDLNAKQKEQFAANAKQVEEDVARATQRPAPVAVPGGFTARFNSADSEKAVRDARAEGLKRALAVLTDDQKAAWKKLTGEPFAHPLDRPASSGSGGIGFSGWPGRAAPGAPGAPGKVPPPANPPAVDPGN